MTISPVSGIVCHVENELIDEAVGRILARVEDRGWGADTDVVFTTDHGEFQGDFGLLFKGPYHVDSLMRLPLIWRPASSAGAVDGAGGAARAQGRQRVLTEWDSRHPTGVEVHLQTIHRDGLTCTAYEPGTVHDGTEGELYDHLPPRPATRRAVQAPV